MFIFFKPVVLKDTDDGGISLKLNKFCQRFGRGKVPISSGRSIRMGVWRQRFFGLSSTTKTRQLAYCPFGTSDSFSLKLVSG